MRRMIISAITLVALAIPASASAYQFSISDPYHRLDPATTAAVQRAVSFQVNAQVSRDWHVNPVTFIPSGGITIHLLPQAAVTTACQAGDEGCHGIDNICVSNSQSTDLLEMTISHEAVEMEVDRWGNSHEICDPASIEYQGLGGVWLNEWVTPSFSPAPIELRQGVGDAL